MRIVQKYGGSSLSSPEKLQAAAQRIRSLVQQGAQVVVVVSAQGDTTDELIEKAHRINPQGSPREMDAYLAAGEQISAGLMAMSLEATGVPAISLCGWQAGLLTDDVHGNARIIKLQNDRILKELANKHVVVVAGFQGVTDAGDITTLGRGGSDTTAVALSAFLQADLCQIFTDVDGIYDRDPRRYPDAQRYTEISYEEMLSLIQNGAQVLHDRSVEIARDYNLKIEVLSSATGAPGTIVGL